MNNDKVVLQVHNLAVCMEGQGKPQILVEDVSFSVQKGSVFAVVGKSGSGKTTLIRALTRLFTTSNRFTVSGDILFDNCNLRSCDTLSLQTLRRHAIRYIFQDPQQALNPVARVREQLLASIQSDQTNDKTLIEALHSVGLSPTILDLYPFQLSVGMAQRVAVAMAVLPKPTLLIADEPTSALDSTHRYQILDIMKSLQEHNHMAIILVTHDLEIAKRYADHVAVMLEGRMVENSSCNLFFTSPQHEYSKQLTNAMVARQFATGLQ